MKQRNRLTPAQHIELGSLLKAAQRNLETAAMLTRRFGRLSQELFELSDRLTGPRSFLERCLIQQVGDDAMVDGVHCRDVYFGLEVEDA